MDVCSEVENGSAIHHYDGTVCVFGGLGLPTPFRLKPSHFRPLPRLSCCIQHRTGSREQRHQVPSTNHTTGVAILRSSSGRLCMYMYVSVCTHIHTYRCIYTYIYIHMYRHMYFLYLYVIRTHLLYLLMEVYMCVYICTCAYMHLRTH